MIAPSSKAPIASKLIAALDKHRKQKVVDLDAWKTGVEQARGVIEGMRPSGDDLSPGFAAYIAVSNWALGLVETIQGLPELRRFIDRIERAEEEYMPSGPPMSPLTRSFFWNWALWDLGVGVKHETLGSILLAVGRHLEMEPLFLGVLERMVSSRLGLHVHEGHKNGCPVLRDLVGGTAQTCEWPSGYAGKAGELWLTRVLPPPGPALSDAVVLTTPYVILAPGIRDWRAYLDRALAKLPADDATAAYARLMKRGLDERYWCEYAFEAYAGDVPEAIFLRGLPDVAESRPHSSTADSLHLA